MKDATSARLNAAKERAFRIIPPRLRQTLTVHACSSNERATNENTNGLLRQYFPKKTDFRDISHHPLAHATDRLNNRPRKRLNYLTPLETLIKAGFARQM
jgi:IS30 family transposase